MSPHLMLLRRHRRSLSALVVAFGAGGFCGCDGHTSINGVVVSSDDKPIEGATVVLEDVNNKGGFYRPSECTTGPNGKFSVGETHAPVSIKFQFTVEKDGYVKHAETFESPVQNEPRRIILTPEKE